MDDLAGIGVGPSAQRCRNIEQRNGLANSSRTGEHYEPVIDVRCRRNVVEYGCPVPEVVLGAVKQQSMSADPSDRVGAVRGGTPLRVSIREHSGRSLSRIPVAVARRR